MVPPGFDLVGVIHFLGYPVEGIDFVDKSAISEALQDIVIAGTSRYVKYLGRKLVRNISFIYPIIKPVTDAASDDQENSKNPEDIP